MEPILLPPKDEVISALSMEAQRALETAERAQSVAHDEATSDQSKAEGKYDTRATEAAYLARGQAERVVALRDLVAWFGRLNPEAPSETVSLGSLVAIGGDRLQVLFVCPAGGRGARVHGTEVKTISLASPLGRAMMGLREGDDFQLQTPAAIQDLEILQLR